MPQQTRPASDLTYEDEPFWQRALEWFQEFLDEIPVFLAHALNRVLKLFLRGSSVERQIRSILPIVDEISALEAETVRLSDEELRAKTDAFRQRLAAGEGLGDVLPEAFAVAREAADRRIGMCSTLYRPHGFDPSRFREPKHRGLFEEARKRLDAAAEREGLAPDAPMAQQIAALGKEIAKLRFPASFYAEIRALYPDYRPPFRMRPFDVQLIGGIVLHQGKIAEMVTGEGKTLVATLPAYLNALAGTHVHVITVNDYLARRDRNWNGPMFESLGLTVGAIQSEMDPGERQPEYAADITYGTNNEFGFDYLRDNMKDSVGDQVQGELQYAIIDEVDSILIDEARTPLIISGPAEESSDRYYVANRMVNSLGGVNAQRLPRDETQREHALQSYDYTFNLKDHSVALTERGIKNAQRFLGVDNLYHGRNMEWPPYIEAALKAKELYKLDVHYVIRDSEVVIVDEFTGRLMPGRRWSDGLHQAVEAKEASHGARIKEENQTLATITFQNFFRLYDKIAGMTGTALTEAGEFMKIYKLDVVPIPTNRPLRRTENHDFIYGTEPEKWGAVVDEIVAVHKAGRPILVGTVSIENSEKLSRLLERRGITHEVLNAKHHEREAGIVALAGQFGAITVSTNMAGRGTDIVLGPCTWQQVLKQWQAEEVAPRDLDLRLDRDELQRRLERHWLDAWGLRKEGENGLPDAAVRERLLKHWKERGMAPLSLADSVADLGGLHIVGTERHEARRIDNQLRGRAGRQGDPGSSRFFVSLEDDLMKIFMAEWVRKFMVRAGLSEGQPIESGMVSRSIERAQRKVEEQNFEVRKNLLEYDEVMDEQRKLIYDQRQEVLEGGEARDPAEVITRGIRRFLAPDLQPPSRRLPERVFALLEALAGTVGVRLTRQEWEAVDRQGLEPLLAAKAREALRGGFTRREIDAWARQVVADCRADGELYPERWYLPRLARWAERLGIELGRDELAGLVRAELAAVVASAVREQAAGADLDDVLARWFTVGFEQDLPLMARTPRWELGTFREWLGRVGVSVEILEWTPTKSTCEALAPLWLHAARKAFAGRPAGDVAADLAAAAAQLYLGSPHFLARPEAARLASWAERRFALRLDPEALVAAYDEAVAPRLAATLADGLERRLKAVSAGEACDLWARSTAEWHLDVHLRFSVHNLIGLATGLSARLRMGLSSLELAKRPAAEIEGYVLGKLAARGEREDEGEHLEGLEDIALTMVEGAIARLLEQALGTREMAPAERSYGPLAAWVSEQGLGISEAQWRAFDLGELRLHFLREAAAAYPAESPDELAADFVPRFVAKPVVQFLASPGFTGQPGYGAMAAWAVGRFPFLPRDAQVEAQLKRFAEDKLKEARQSLIQAKIEEFGQEPAELDRAIDELVPATMETFRSFTEGDEVDFSGLAAFARKAFDLPVQVQKLEEEAEGDDREAVRVLAEMARGPYARRGLDKLVHDAVEGISALCMPPDQFPSEWRCDRLQEWLRAVGLSSVASAEDIREDVLGEIQAYFTRSAVAAQAQRPVELTRADLVTAALQVFLETSLTEEGNDFIGLANATANKFGVQLEPFELSKLDAEELDATLRDRVFRTYDARKAELGPKRMLWTIRQLLLQTIDIKWKDHLYNMDHLRGVIGFRGYGQQDPKVEYKREGYSMFDQMTRSIEDTVTDYLLKVEFSFGEGEARSVWRADSYIHEAAESYKAQQAAATAPQGGERPVARPVTVRNEPGRNDPCPCGRKRPDGKPVKYKNCCGRKGAAAR